MLSAQWKGRDPTASQAHVSGHAVGGRKRKVAAKARFESSAAKVSVHRDFRIDVFAPLLCEPRMFYMATTAHVKDVYVGCLTMQGCRRS